MVEHAHLEALMLFSISACTMAGNPSATALRRLIKLSPTILPRSQA